MYDNPILYADGTAKKEDLDRIEQKFHVKIPGEMREHYLAYNGGRPERTVFTDKNGDEYFVDLFIPVRERFKRPLEKRLELLRADDGVIPDWLIPFAEEGGGNLFCFSVRESDPGAIYYYNHEFEYGEDPEEQITWLAESLTAFLNALTENEEDGDEDDEDDPDEDDD